MRPGADRAAAFALSILLLATGSCAPRTLRIDQLERRLSDALGSELDVDGIRVGCPATVEIERGGVFDCVATAPDGDRLTIRVTQVDDDGAVRWRTIAVDG